AEQATDRLFRQYAAIEQRVEDRFVQRLHRALVVVHPVRVPEAAGQQQVGELRDQIFEIQAIELIADVFGVAILHGALVVILLLPARQRDRVVDLLLLAPRAAPWRGFGGGVPARRAPAGLPLRVQRRDPYVP